MLPLQPGTKHPLTSHGSVVRGQKSQGYKDGSSDLVTVFKWWRRYPNANIAIVCGASGLVVLDVDAYRDGEEDLRRLEGEWGALPTTVEALSGGGGRHLLFNHPGGELVGKLPLDVDAKDRGIDVKDFGYIVASPSTHPDTRRAYEWSVDGHPDDVDIADLPAKWITALQSGASKQSLPRSPGQDHDDPLRRIPASEYVARLTGREIQRGGLFTCPWHAGGDEWDPSLKVEGELWACHGCPPILGKRALGGNVYDMAGIIAGYAIPLRGGDYLDVRERLRRLFKV